MFNHLNSKVNTYHDLKFVYFFKQNVRALVDCRESKDKPAADRIFASETDKKRGIYSRSLAREGEPNKKNLREQARSYARFLCQGSNRKRLTSDSRA